MSPSRTDRTLRLFAAVSAFLAASVVILILAFLLAESLPLLREIRWMRLLSDSAWLPTQGSYGLGPMVAATLGTTLAAVLLAIPAGVLSALFCRYYAPPPVALVYRRCVELLGGVPSVVYGFWGLVVLVPLLAKIEPPGASFCAAVLVLALMILPTIVLSADAALASVPVSYFHGAMALGLLRWRAAWCVILPAARSGLFTSVLLASVRALGETMAVLMVGGNIVQMPKSLFDPMRTLTANVALEMAYATQLHRSALFVSGLMLMIVVIGLVYAADRIGGKRV